MIGKYKIEMLEITLKLHLYVSSRTFIYI